METATVTGELLGTPNAEIRKNLTGDQPKLFELWLVHPRGIGGASSACPADHSLYTESREG